MYGQQGPPKMVANRLKMGKEAHLDKLVIIFLQVRNANFP